MPFFNYYITLFKKPLFIVSYCTLVVLCYFYWDRPLALYFHSLHFAGYDGVIQFATHLGLVKYYLMLLGIPYLFFQFIIYKPQWARPLLFILLAIAVAGISCDILKVILSRARPEPFFDYQIYGFKFFQTNAEFWSFPSGHTTVITAFMLALSYLKPRYWPIFLLINIIVASTRFILTAHYLSDVLATFLITTYIVMLIYVFMLKLDDILAYVKRVILRVLDALKE